MTDSPIAITRSHLHTQLMALSRSQRATWMAVQLRQHPETAAVVALLLDELSADLRANRPQPSERTRKLPPPLRPGEWKEEERILSGGTIAQILSEMEVQGIPLTAEIIPGRDYCDEVIKARWIRPLTGEEKAEVEARIARCR